MRSEKYMQTFFCLFGGGGAAIVITTNNAATTHSAKGEKTKKKEMEKSASDSWPNYVITTNISWFSSVVSPFVRSFVRATYELCCMFVRFSLSFRGTIHVSSAMLYVYYQTECRVWEGKNPCAHARTHAPTSCTEYSTHDKQKNKCGWSTSEWRHRTPQTDDFHYSLSLLIFTVRAFSLTHSCRSNI